MSLDDETILMVSAYQDGELSPSETLMMERRIAAEPELRALADELRSLSSELKGALSGYASPESLRSSIIGALGFADEFSLRQNPTRWLAIAASLLMGALVGGGIVAGLDFGKPSAYRSISNTVFEAHLRSLAAPQPFDVASSDRHVVKPWFNGKVNVAPSAPELGSAGFPLIGGRIDIVEGASAPVLVYRHDRHIISVTVLPRQPGTVEGEETRDGYNIERWMVGDLSYWTVSDLNEADLRRFAVAFRDGS